jgi:hypothetical protein
MIPGVLAMALTGGNPAGAGLASGWAPHRRGSRGIILAIRLSQYTT